MSVTVSFPSRVEDITGSDYLAVTPQPAALPLPVITLCKDIVSGYTGDYVLFQFQENEYVLMLSDSFEMVDGFSYISSSDFTAYDIVVQSHMQTVTKYTSGTLSGSVVGVGDGATVQEWSGSALFTYEDTVNQPDTYALYYDIFQDKQVMLFNSDNGIIYSSFDGFAKLQDGASHYGFLLCVCAAGVIMFGLVHALFKRLI